MIILQLRARYAPLIVGACLVVATSGVVASAKTLVYCSEGSPETFYPPASTSKLTADAAGRQIFNKLIEFKRGTGEIEPGLAERYDVSDDGKTVTFHLRRGVKFQTTRSFKPTRDLNADDVIFSFTRQSDKDNPWYKVTTENHAYYRALGFEKLIKSIDRVDDYTVRFHLGEATATFLTNMALDFASILSKEYGDILMKAGTPEKIDQEPIGTGPFSLVAYQKNSMIRYKAHDGYYKGRPKIDDLVFAITPDASVRWQKTRAGECQLMALPNPTDLDAIRKDPSVTLLEQPGFNENYVIFNVTKKPFDDKRVRQAVALAINKKTIMDAIYLGAGVSQAIMLPPGMLGYDESIEDYPYDPEKAKKLLAEAGYPNGFSAEHFAWPTARAYLPNGRRMAELIQADLAKVGIKLEVKTQEFGEHIKRILAGEHEFAQWGRSDINGDPDTFFATLFRCGSIGSLNVMRWCNKEFDDLTLQAISTFDPKKRAALYKKALILFKEEAPAIPIATATQIEPVRKEVVDYKMSPFGFHNFEAVDIKR